MANYLTEEHTVQGVLKAAWNTLAGIDFFVLFPLLLLAGVLGLICFWLYLVVWCRWKGGPE